MSLEEKLVIVKKEGVTLLADIQVRKIKIHKEISKV